MTLLVSSLRVVKHSARLVYGLAVYLATGKTPTPAALSLITLNCLPRGYSNDLLARITGLFNRPRTLADADGVLGAMSERTVRDRVTQDLRARGYHIFQQRLPAEHCERLLQYALSQPGRMRAA